MTGAAALDREFLAWCLQQPGVPRHKLAAQCPDFLVISPPKTGSTWLADNLRCHPQVFLPPVKEIKYFSSFFKWLDLNWYLDHFAPAAGRVKGEASPSYALLPVERIRLVRRLMPDVKLIFLMRDPVARAWSHARHTCRFREANFASHNGGFQTASESQWRENFTHDWPLASGDYLGQLRRWLSVFPREQFHIGFYESIAERPEALLREVFDFLGMDADVDLFGFPVHERILAGTPGELLPSLERFLHQLLHQRTAELASFLGEQFNLQPPPSWQTLLGYERDASIASDWDFDDSRLTRVLEQEEAFPSARCSVLDGYRGYDIVCRHGTLYAIEPEFDRDCLEETDEAALRRWQEKGTCFAGSSLAEVKERVDQYVFERAETKLRSSVEPLREGLREAREQIARLERALEKTDARLAEIRPWYVYAGSAVRRALRSIRGSLIPRKWSTRSAG